MAKDRPESYSESINLHRNPNLLSHYHDCASRVFYNNGRANEYLHNLFLKAAKNGEIDRIRNFLKRSSRNNNVNVDYKDVKTGNTAIILAAVENHTEVVQLLLNYGADITLHNEQGQSVIELAPNSILPTLLASVNRQGVSNRHLLQAAWQGNVEVLKRLLSSQVDLNVNCKNADGMTPLLLVTRDVNLFEKIEKEVSEKGYHPLQIVRELLQHNADPSLASSDGRSALHYTASNKGKTAEEMTNVIIEGHDSCIELPDEFNCLPIHIASREDNCPVLLALIDNGADVNAKGYNGQTPLHMSAVHGHAHSSSVLIGNGADVTLVDDYGYSAVEVTTNKKLHRVLKDAWCRQTGGVSIKSRRSFSAPNEHKRIVAEETQEAQNVPVKEKTLSPRKLSPAKGLSTASIVNKDTGQPHAPKKPVVRSKSMTMTPSPPKTSRTERSTPQTRQISSRSQESAIYGQGRFELPKLSVKNIELQYSSSRRSEHPLYNNIERIRLLTPGHVRSSPGTPNTFGSYRCSNAKRLEFSLQTTRRNKIPTRIAPLPGNRSVTPELSLSPISGLGGTGQFVDLDFLQNNSDYLASLAKLAITGDRGDSTSLVQPPSSPCDNQHTISETGTENSKEMGNEIVMGNEKEIESELNVTSFDADDNTNDNENENQTKNVHEKSSGNMDEKSSGNMDEKSSGNIDQNDEEAALNCDDTSAVYPTQTFSSSEISSFWIPNNKDNEKDSNTEKTENVKNINENTNENNIQEKTNKRERTSSTSSCSFYVDINDVNLPAYCASCNNQLDSTSKSRLCTKCTLVQQNHPQRNTYWISIDGEMSDGKAEAPNSAKKIRYPHTEKSTKEKCKRKTRLLPALTQPSVPFHSGRLINEETQKHKKKNSKDDDLKLVSEGTFVKEAETTSQDNEDNPELGLQSEGTFVIDSNMEDKSEQCSQNECEGKNIDDEKKSSECIESRNGDDDCHEKMDTSCTKDNIDDRDINQKQCDNSSATLDKSNIDKKNSENVTINIITVNMLSKQNKSTNNDRMVLLSVSTDDENISETTGTQIESTSSTQGTLNADHVKGPKSAWSNNDGVQICNAFPSPVPPCHAKPEVQPPIGEKNARRKTSGKKGKKSTETKKEKCVQSKNGNKKEQVKKGKKKSKKKNQSFKEITVNQSNADAAYMTETGLESCDLTVGLPSPDVDNAPTISIDSRTFSGLLMKKGFPVLSPIPESPYSNASTPRPIDINLDNNIILHSEENSGENNGAHNSNMAQCSDDHISNMAQCSDDHISNNPQSCDNHNVNIMQNLNSKTSRIAQNNGTLNSNVESHVTHCEESINAHGNGYHNENTDTRTNASDKMNTCGEAENNVATTHDDPTNNDPQLKHDGGDDDNDDVVFDEVDGGMISRLFGMCIPRLNNINNDDSDQEDLVDDINVNHNHDDDDDDKEDNDEEDEDDKLVNDHKVAKSVLYKDEVSDDVEDMLQEILQNTDNVDKSRKTNCNEKNSEDINKEGDGKIDGDFNDKNRSDNSDGENALHDHDDDDLDDTIEGRSATLDDKVTSNRQSKKKMKKQWTLKYIDQMSQVSQDSQLDDVFDKDDNTNNNDVFVEDELSDNDSSYISCDSTPRGVSDCSTFESSDSVLSPHNSRMTTHEDETPYESVDINSHEQFHKTSNSSSSDSRSTISNNSVVSMQSFFAVKSRPFVHSRVSVGSISSAASCGEEIQWQKGNILGKGGFGTVWLGLVNTGEMIAVKQVELNHSDDSEAEKQYEKLQEEVSLLKSLRHKNIVRYIGTCLDEHFVVNIFMEYVPGGSIAQALKRFGAFVEPVFRRYTKQILCGVEYLHVNSVVHRDIKGGNIMLMPNGVIKLIDFGCAKRLCMHLSRSSMLNSIKGTPYWMAPEVIKETGAGTKSDIWSIGCTVFEMATGTPPWSDMQPMAAIFSIGNGSSIPHLGESFSQLARDFTTACMTREPEARPSATELLKHDFLKGLL